VGDGSSPIYQVTRDPGRPLADLGLERDPLQRLLFRYAQSSGAGHDKRAAELEGWKIG
jgi:hypothetical protein